MPYQPSETKRFLDVGMDPKTVGELNYCVTKLTVDFLGETPRYADFNGAIGALECAKQELYRRIVAPYEDIACAKNGDVYHDDI